MRSNIRLLGFIVTLPLIGIYVYLACYPLAIKTIYTQEFMIAYGISILLMFLWKVPGGEEAYLTFFETDLYPIGKTGLFLLPNLLPPVRGIEIVLGFGIRIGGKKDNTSASHHHVDTRDPFNLLNIVSSLLKANINKLIGMFFGWLFTIRGRGGEIEYYRVGRLFLLITLIFNGIFAFFFPPTGSPYSSSWSFSSYVLYFLQDW